MIYFWQLYALGAVCLILGALGMWKAPKLSGLSVLAMCTFTAGQGLIAITAAYQYRPLFWLWIAGR